MQYPEGEREIGEGELPHTTYLEFILTPLDHLKDDSHGLRFPSGMMKVS